MSLSIALNSKQLENLSKESLKLKTNYAVKGIDLFINSLIVPFGTLNILYFLSINSFL